MKDLIEKLEAATEAEQERLILETLQFAYDRDWMTGVKFVMVRAWMPLGAYLSAAVVLVPEGWFYRLDTSGADVQLWHPDKRWEEHRGFATTPALAITIAAMKAHDSQRTDTVAEVNQFG